MPVICRIPTTIKYVRRRYMRAFTGGEVGLARPGIDKSPLPVS